MLNDYLKNKFFSQIEFGIMVEVGAAGPEYLSQSKPFRDARWRCICVEPNPNFAQMHRDIGNEIYEYACSNCDGKNVDFYVNSNSESFSSLGVSDDICKSSGYYGSYKLSLSKIKVDVKKLDNILEEAKVLKTDLIIIDVEGWELNVMQGLTTKKYQPKVIVLEVIGEHNHKKYNDYMRTIGYEFDSFDYTTGPNLIYYNENY
jgi:FkbM family methyltransferase